VAIRLIGSGCRSGGEWGRSRMGVCDGGSDHQREGQFWGEFVASHCNL